MIRAMDAAPIDGVSMQANILDLECGRRRGGAGTRAEGQLRVIRARSVMSVKDLSGSLSIPTVARSENEGNFSPIPSMLLFS